MVTFKTESLFNDYLTVMISIFSSRKHSNVLKHPRYSLFEFGLLSFEGKKYIFLMDLLHDYIYTSIYCRL